MICVIWGTRSCLQLATSTWTTGSDQKASLSPVRTCLNIVPEMSSSGRRWVNHLHKRWLGLPHHHHLFFFLFFFSSSALLFCVSVELFVFAGKNKFQGSRNRNFPPLLLFLHETCSLIWDRDGGNLLSVQFRNRFGRRCACLRACVCVCWHRALGVYSVSCVP